MQSHSTSAAQRNIPRRRLLGRDTGRAALAYGLLATGALLSVATSSRPPLIAEMRPAMGESAVALDAEVTVTFEEPVDPDTVDDRSVRLVRKADGTEVAVSRSLREGDRVLVLSPATPLEAEADYEVHLDLDRLASRDGEAFAGLRLDADTEAVLEASGTLVISFTTRSALRVARAIRTADPDEIRVYFSEAVDPAGLTLDAVSLSCGGEPVEVDLRYSDEEKRLRVLPLQALAARGACALRLAGSIRSVRGNALGGGRGEVLSFDASDALLR